MHMRRKPLRIGSWPFLAAILLLLSGPARGDEPAAGPPPPGPPGIIYVTDFEIQTEAVKPDTGLLAERPRPLKRLFGHAPGEKDPEAQAIELVDLMAKSLVAELSKAGYRASRLYPGAPIPPEGYLLRGIFVRVDEGNRLQRAVIGFGAGETELQVEASLDDLTAGVPQPFYKVDAGDESRKLPGGIIMRNPYVMAARFVMSGDDLDKNVKNTAFEIVKNIAARVEK